MKIKECAYFWVNETCNLLPHSATAGMGYTFIDCEAVPISECPYKLYNLGKIDKIELNKRIEVLAKCN